MALITVNEILQVNGTVIAGILVLLTITAFRSSKPTVKVRYMNLTLRQSIAFVIVPFSASSLIILMSILPNLNYPDLILFWSDVLSGIGFLYLIFTVIFAEMPTVE